MSDTSLTADILAAIERHGGWRNMLNKLEAAQAVDDAADALVKSCGGSVGQGYAIVSTDAFADLVDALAAKATP